MRKQRQLILAFAAISAFLICTGLSDGNRSVETRVFKNKNGFSIPYRILKPDDYDPKTKYPLVLCLHGAGGRGTDNQNRGIHAYNVLSQQIKTYSAFLLTPQCPKEKQWVNTAWSKGSYSIAKVPISEQMKCVVEILKEVRKKFNIDPNRIYVTGQSMGGYGTWDIILRYPRLFAAAIPVCGAGDPDMVARIAHLPIWVFHGGRDKTVPPDGSRDMVNALRKAGSKVKYTEYPDAGHNSWRQAWKEKEIIPWLFRQRKRDDNMKTPSSKDSE